MIFFSLCLGSLTFLLRLLMSFLLFICRRPKHNRQDLKIISNLVHRVHHILCTNKCLNILSRLWKGLNVQCQSPKYAGSVLQVLCFSLSFVVLFLLVDNHQKTTAKKIKTPLSLLTYWSLWYWHFLNFSSNIWKHFPLAPFWFFIQHFFANSSPEKYVF